MAQIKKDVPLYGQQKTKFSKLKEYIKYDSFEDILKYVFNNRKVINTEYVICECIDEDSDDCVLQECSLYEVTIQDVLFADQIQNNYDGTITLYCHEVEMDTLQISEISKFHFIHDDKHICYGDWG